jgi:hypothetical protein
MQGIKMMRRRRGVLQGWREAWFGKCSMRGRRSVDGGAEVPVQLKGRVSMQNGVLAVGGVREEVDDVRVGAFDCLSSFGGRVILWRGALVCKLSRVKEVWHWFAVEDGFGVNEVCLAVMLSRNGWNAYVIKEVEVQLFVFGKSPFSAQDENLKS